MFIKCYLRQSKCQFKEQEEKETNPPGYILCDWVWDYENRYAENK